jgi:hypothetical protein
MNRFERVREICGGWGLYEEGNSTEKMQILKAISEAGELADSIAKNDREQAKDDIGDILVCLINACHISGYGSFSANSRFFTYRNYEILEVFGKLTSCLGDGILVGISYSKVGDYIATVADIFGLTIDECLDQAISEIEKRKGKIVNGVFIKDAN